MRQAFLSRQLRSVPYHTRVQESKYLFGALSIWALLAVVGVSSLLIMSGVSGAPRGYLIPWAIVLGILTLAPPAYYWLRGRFDLFHPLVYPVWTYFFPGFAIGGMLLAFGFSEAHYIAYIRDEPYTLPLTCFYLIMGFLSVVAGFAVPFAGRIGEFVRVRLPKWELTDSEARRGGLILLVLGVTSIFLAFFFGVLGFQRRDEIVSFGGLVAISTVFWYQATFMLALYGFRADTTTQAKMALFAVLLLISIGNALLVGSRSGLLHFVLPILAAYFYSGRKITFKHYVGFAAVMTTMLIAGMIYGTTFRSVRESQQMVSLDRYVASVPDTFELILDRDPVRVLEDGLATLAGRVELVSSVAVVVSNYEELAPYEEELGISNNILSETLVFFIPRIIWTEKPISIEPAKYAELYFNYSENAFSMTPIGDLLRNFGPIGIPVGMFFLGVLLRTLYVALVDSARFSYWRLSLYYLLATGVSYDGTFAGIIPTMFKATVVACVGFVIVWLVTRRFRPA